MTDPIDPSKNPVHKPPNLAGETHSPKSPPPAYGKITAKPMTFLGMHFTGPEAEKLWNVITKQVCSAIQKQQARALKALRKLRKSDSSD